MYRTQTIPPLNAQAITAKAAKGITDALAILKKHGAPNTDAIAEDPLLEGHLRPTIQLMSDNEGSAHLTGATYLLENSLLKIGFIKGEGGGFTLVYDQDATPEMVNTHLNRLCTLRGWEITYA